MSQDITLIIHQWHNGNKTAETELYQFAYLQLRTIAQQERARSAKKHGDSNLVISDCINNTTALIHDAYLKLAGTDLSHIENRRQFYLMAAKVMRQILIDHARSLNALKRQPVTQEQQTHDDDSVEQLLSMDRMLDNFSLRYPRQSNALKLKYLLGMKNQEISQLLQCSDSLIEKDLKFSRSWLQAQMTCSKIVPQCRCGT